MVQLWGREYTREALLQRIGRLDQIGGVEAAVLADGAERGVRALRFTSAAGLVCTVVPDRGMDVPDMSWRGRSLCWHDACGRVAPTLFQPEDNGFLRSFFGGMLTTCGLTNFGPGGQDGGETLYLHGLASNLPAAEVAWGSSWEGDDCWLWARGTTRQARLFGENITLYRHLRMRLDGSALELEDLVRNEGWSPSPHMILYHCNAGFPLLDEGTRMLGSFASVTHRDDDASRGLAGFDRFGPPEPGFKEQVFIIAPRADAGGWHEVTVWNPTLDGGLGLRLRWDGATLPALFLWRMLGQGAYVLGVEPANCPYIRGRQEARAAGGLPLLEPGEERRYHLRFEVVTGVPA